MGIIRRLASSAILFKVMHMIVKTQTIVKEMTKNKWIVKFFCAKLD